ncbi:MAG: hypothetical protein ACREIA_03260, partial [Opitutaceae bacterium]
ALTDAGAGLAGLLKKFFGPDRFFISLKENRRFIDLGVPVFDKPPPQVVIATAPGPLLPRVLQSYIVRSPDTVAASQQCHTDHKLGTANLLKPCKG